MIIDFILDRMDGCSYDSKEFYDYVTEESSVFDFCSNIARALDSGTEQDIKEQLCNYIEQENYNPEIKNYVNSVSWL